MPSRIVSIALLMASVLACVPVAARAQATQPGARPKPVEGKVTAVDASSITLEPTAPAGEEQAEAKTYAIDDKTRVHIMEPAGDKQEGGGSTSETLVPKPAKKEDLKVGQTVLVRQRGGSDGVAASISILKQPEDGANQTSP